MSGDLPQIALASQSPRRRQLLDQIGVGYTCLLVSVEEIQQPGESASDFVIRLAREKAQAGRQLILETGEWPESLPVLGADTAVVLDDEVFGKPTGPDHARAMLTRLSGRRHQVLTGVALATPGGILHRLQSSSVSFDCMPPHAIDAYWQSGEPADKAGAYAVQGLAAGFISDIQGSFSGVMGLPVFETVALLREAGVFAVDSLFGPGHAGHE